MGGSGDTLEYATGGQALHAFEFHEEEITTVNAGHNGIIRLETPTDPKRFVGQSRGILKCISIDTL